MWNFTLQLLWKRSRGINENIYVALCIGGRGDLFKRAQESIALSMCSVLFCYADRKCFKLSVDILFKIFSLKKICILVAYYQTGKGNEIKA